MALAEARCHNSGRNNMSEEQIDDREDILPAAEKTSKAVECWFGAYRNYSKYGRIIC